MKKKAEIQTVAFIPYTTNPTVAERAVLILLLILAAFLRLHKLGEVPPGIHDDEIINVQIVDQLRAGAPISIFYEAGEGREGLYHLLLLASRSIIAQVPYWYRLPSVACSLLTIVLVYLLSRRWFGPWVALVTAGGLAVAFWPVYLGREALRGGTFPLVSAGMMLAFWRGLEQPDQTDNGKRSRSPILWFALAGLLLGLTQYTYLAARVVPVFVVLFIAYLALFHPARWRLHRQGIALFLVVGILVAMPLALYVGTHWGQQERITRLNEPLQALLSGDPRPVLSSATATLGMFVWRGDPQPHYNLPGRPVFEPVGGILFIGGVLIALAGIQRPALTFCLLWTAVMLTPGMLSQPAPHFIRTSGVLVTTFIFPGLAVQWVARQKSQRWRISLAMLLALLLSANVGLTVRDYFQRWLTLDEVRSFRHAGLAEVTRYLDRTPDTTPVAVCTPFLNEQHFFWRTDRQALPYLLNRRGLNVGWYNCLEAQLFPHGGKASRYLLQDDLPFASFVPPQWIEEAQTIATFDENHLVYLEVADEVEVWLAQFTRSDAASLSFGETMTFLGYQTKPTGASLRDTLEVLTAWQVINIPPNDLAIFLHLYAEDGALVAQGDALAALSDTFSPEDIFIQRHVLTLSPDIPPGTYQLATGLYIRQGNRLSLDAGAGDTLTLSTLEILGNDN